MTNHVPHALSWTGQGVDCIWSMEDVCKADWETQGVVPYPMEHCSTLLPIQGGASLRFRQPFLWIASTDPIDVRGECANSLTGWFLEVSHYFYGSKWSQFLVGDVSITELLCVAHWNGWRHLQSSSWFAAHPLSFLCRQWWGLGKLFFVEMKGFCNTQLTCDYRRSDAWFD